MWSRCRQWLDHARGWRRNATAFGFGVSATLTLPPVFAFPLLIPAFAGLYVLIDGAPSRRRAFADGWWWGWGFHISGLYWFCIALLTDPEKFAWLIPFALFALTAVIALYAGIACWLWACARCRGVKGIVLFATLWALVEYARGHLFTGFPWNLAGYSFTISDALLQLASLAGAYGLTWFAVLLGAMPAAWGDRHVSPAGAKRAVGIVYAALLIGAVWGVWQLHRADSLLQEARYVPGVKLRLVQANIAQEHKWDANTRAQGIQEHVRLTQSPGIESITHVIWPETAVPHTIRAGTSLPKLLGAAIPPRTLLITGSLRVEGDETNWDLYNSIVVLTHDGAIAGSYDKHKLVPFGEFVPFRRLLPDALLTPVGDKDFSRGPGTQTLSWPGLPPVSPLICYEAIFPELVVNDYDRPAWLLNLTNDAWFGRSSGPYQHLHMARFRAAEQGVPLVRVANTGVTAIVDSYGRIISQLELGKTGILDGLLPAPNPLMTLFSAYRSLVITGLTLLALILTISQRRPKNN